MAAVLVVHAARVLISAAAIKVYVLAASFATLLSLVSLPHILSNLEQVGISGFATFFFVAFVKTGILVRLMVLVGAVALLSLLVDVIRHMPKSRSAALA